MEPTDTPSPTPPEPDRAVVRAVQDLQRRLGIDGLGLDKVAAGAMNMIPAWRRETRGEHRAAATLAILATVTLMVLLPARIANRPRYLLPGLALLLLVALVIASPARLTTDSKLLRGWSLVLIALLSIANAASAIRLVVDLARAQGIREPTELLLTGGAIWLTNVLVFSLWYWESDRGGPVQRALGSRGDVDFLFPQMDKPDLCGEDWEPTYVDYLYLSFTNATAFSPTDVLPMTRWTKLVMMLQSTISVVTVALVVARAVNVLR